MAKINGITQKTQNSFVNLYELDRESKTGKKGKYYVASRAKNQEELKLRTRKNTPDGVIIYSLYGEKQDRVEWCASTDTVLMIISTSFRQAW